MEAANSIPGVKAAATGELKITGLEVKTVPALSGGDSVIKFLCFGCDISESSILCELAVSVVRVAFVLVCVV